MQEPHGDSSQVEHLLSTERQSFPVHASDRRMQQELNEHFESALVFADFCSFLTAGRVRHHARSLVALTEALYAETTEDLQRGATPG